MSMRVRTVVGNVYHVLNRGVDKRKIFLDSSDHLRFIHDLFEFNDIEPTNNIAYYFRQTKDVGRPYIGRRKRKMRNFLVEILAFCLMPNHYHLLLKPVAENGIPQFMKKINGGYSTLLWITPKGEPKLQSGAIWHLIEAAQIIDARTDYSLYASTALSSKKLEMGSQLLISLENVHDHQLTVGQ